MGDTAYSYPDGRADNPYYAAKVCSDYTFGDYDDWFLPSKEELNLIYQRLSSIGVGDTISANNAVYWSSSECSESPADSVWAQNLLSGEQVQENRGWGRRVWPIRAF